MNYLNSPCGPLSWPDTFRYVAAAWLVRRSGKWGDLEKWMRCEALPAASCRSHGGALYVAEHAEVAIALLHRLDQLNAVEWHSTYSCRLKRSVKAWRLARRSSRKRCLRPSAFSAAGAGAVADVAADKGKASICR
ncbi:hypothetical protein [Variovorax paradoxus]|uniref:Uncharacterized protein n=1 Tax=Variovorax paradoxus TaxID=34073 RepID=A0A6I6HJ15_VARPD|nr:hypothetical protein [Variovorax paradoxus]QGW82697.1 hypothetical protein GOQ09_14440 [Variovorax paradoxus]